MFRQYLVMTFESSNRIDLCDFHRKINDLLTKTNAVEPYQLCKVHNTRTE